MAIATVEVEIDLDDIDTDDLVDALQARGVMACDGSVSVEIAKKFYELLASGNEQEALLELRTIVQDVTGRVLP